MPGLLIAFEGLDGVGKSTCSRLLAARLQAHWTTTPGDGLREVRAAIESALPDPIARQLFYAASVRQVSEDACLRLARGEVVVVDRYWASTLAYAACRPAAVDLDAVEATLVPADLTVFLSADASCRARRLAQRGEWSCNDQQTLARDGDARLREAFAGVLRRPFAGRVVELDCTELSVEEVVAHLELEHLVGATGRPILSGGRARREVVSACEARRAGKA